MLAKLAVFAVSSIVLVAVLSYLALRVLERFGKEPQHTLSSRSIVLLVLLFGLGLCSYFLTGDSLRGDAHSHTARTWLFADILSKGELPIWTNKWYLGYPIGLYYGFLYYFVTGAISALTSLSPLLITKLTLVGFHLASGFALFHLAFLCSNNRIAALFASLFYVYSFQHTGILIVAGALPLGLIFLLLPLLFISLERVQDRSPTTEIFYLSIQAAALASCLFFTHIQYGFYAVFCFFLVALVRVLHTLSRRENLYAWAIGKFLFLTGGITLIFSGWFLLPLVAEKQYLLLSSEDTLGNLIGTFSWQDVSQAIQRIVTPSRHVAWTHFYFGVIPLGLVLLGSLGFFSRFRQISSRYASYVIIFIISIPFALSSRFVSVWFFLACVISAWGVQFALESDVLKRLPSPIKNNVPLILVVALLLNCGITLVQRSNHLLPTFDLADSPAPAGRLAVLHAATTTVWRSLDVIATGRSSIFGGIPQSSTKTHPYVAAISTRAAVELLDKQEDMSELSRNAFRMLNVTDLVVPSRQRVYAFKDATPAIFAMRAVLGHSNYAILEAETWWSVIDKFEQRSLDYSVTDEIVREMEIHAERPLANAIIMHPSLAAAVISRLNGEKPLSGTADFTILKSHESHTRFDMEYASSEAGIVQLSYAYFPYLKVKLDGNSVAAYPSALGLLVLSVPAGRHSISIEAGVSPLRIRWLMLAIVGAFVLGIFSLVYLRLRSCTKTLITQAGR